MSKVPSYEEIVQLVGTLNRKGNQWESIIHKNMKLTFIGENFAGYLFDFVIYFSENTNRWTFTATKHVES
jgi:phage pi2 protein 07